MANLAACWRDLPRVHGAWRLGAKGKLLRPTPETYQIRLFLSVVPSSVLMRLSVAPCIPTETSRYCLEDKRPTTMFAGLLFMGVHDLQQHYTSLVVGTRNAEATNMTLSQGASR